MEACRSYNTGMNSGVFAPRRSGFSLIELLVVLSIIVVLAGLLLPTVGIVKSMARSTQCANNLRQLGLACSSYSDDWESSVVPTAWNVKYWGDYLTLYYNDTLGNGNVFKKSCPSFKGTGWQQGYAKTEYAKQIARNPSASKKDYDIVGGTNSYGIVGRIFVQPEITHRSERILLGDSGDWYAQEGGWALTGVRHRKTGNFLFFDLHIEARTTTMARRGITLP